MQEENGGGGPSSSTAASCKGAGEENAGNRERERDVIVSIVLAKPLYKKWQWSWWSEEESLPYSLSTLFETNLTQDPGQRDKPASFVAAGICISFLSLAPPSPLRDTFHCVWNGCLFYESVMMWIEKKLIFGVFRCWRGSVMATNNHKSTLCHCNKQICEHKWGNQVHTHICIAISGANRPWENVDPSTPKVPQALIKIVVVGLETKSW